MRRTVLICVLLGLATGCGAGGRGSLFSANNTRVPPPGTKSYGTPDNNYYNSNAPRGLSMNSDAPGAGLSGNLMAANNENVPSGDLNWRAPGTRLSSPVLPDLGAMPPPPSMSSRVAPASFSAPIVPPTSQRMASNENPVRVLESGVIGTGVAPRLSPTPVNNAFSMNEPAPFRATVDASEITQLPKVTNVPRIRMANSNAPNPGYMPGSTVPATSVPPISYSQTTPSSSAASTAPTLNWRTKP